MRLEPSVSTGVSYTDNVDFDNEPRDDFVYFVRPRVALVLDSRRFQTSLDLALSFEYSTDEEGFTIEQLSTTQLDSVNTFEVVDNTVFVDARASVSRELIDAENRPSASETESDDDLTTVQRYLVSPFVQQRFGRFVENETRASAGYVTTGDADGDDAVLLGLGTEFSSGPLFGWFQWRLGSQYDVQDASDDDERFERLTNEVNTTSRINRSVAFLANAGHDDIDDSANDDVPDGFFWNLGFDWRPSPRLTATATIGRRFEGRDLNFDIDYEFRGGMTFTASFQQTLETEEQQFQRELGSLVIADQVSSAGGLGISDDPFIRNRFDSALNYSRGRNNYSIVGFFESREFQTDLSSTERNYGSVATWSRQLNRRTRGSIALGYERTEFEDMDDRVDDLYTVRTSLSHNLGEGLSIGCSYVFQRQESTDETEIATENFVAVTLTKRF